MKISELEAIEIASKFAQRERRRSDIPLKYESASAVFNENIPSVSYLKIKSEYWSVFFSLNFSNSEVAVVDPDHVIVAVSADNGDAEWYPLM